MKNLQNVVQEVPISKIRDDITDFRDPDQAKKDRDSEEFEQLKVSIGQLGLLSPIHVVEKNSFFSLVDGRRRYQACMELGMKHVPVLVLANRTEDELIAITLVQNIHRKGLSDVEKTRGIIKLFDMHGYSIDDLLTNVKTMHNKADKAKDIDPKFIQLVNTIGYSPNTIYILVQIMRDVPAEAIKILEKFGASMPQKQFLTNSKLRAHPKIQIRLAKDMKDLDNEQSRQLVKQTIHNLQTGSLYKSEEDENKYSYDVEKYEDLDNKQVIETEKTPTVKFLDIAKANSNLLRRMTGHIISRDEYNYDIKHIQYTKDWRKEIVTEMDKLEAQSLRHDMIITQHAIKSMLDLLDAKFPT